MVSFVGHSSSVVNSVDVLQDNVDKLLRICSVAHRCANRCVEYIARGLSPSVYKKEFDELSRDIDVVIIESANVSLAIKRALNDRAIILAADRFEASLSRLRERCKSEDLPLFYRDCVVLMQDFYRAVSASMATY